MGERRSFVVTDEHVRRAGPAAFLAWYRFPRFWVQYALYVAATVLVVLLTGNVAAAALAPLAIGAHVLWHWRAAARDTREQEPVGTEVHLDFREDDFGYRTWVQSGDVPYAAVTHVIAARGCLVVVALSHRIFWALPPEVIPSDAVTRMRA